MSPSFLNRPLTSCLLPFLGGWLLVAGARAQAPAPAPSRPPTSIEEIAERLRSLEERNRQLERQLETTRRDSEAKIDRLVKQVEDLSRTAPTPESAEKDAAALVDNERPAESDSPVPDYTEGQFATDVAKTIKAPAPATGARFPLTATFGPGFRFDDKDGEFRFRVHLESQFEGRVWGPDGRIPAGGGVDGIYLPRQRIFFDGNITKWLQYELSINRGLGNINILNAYVNLKLRDEFQLRLGRFFTPLQYDQYAISNYWLPTPERSLFTTNVGLNRQFGLKAWGYLFDNRVDYAAGIFNGSRNSFENTNGAMDFVGFLNARPFQDAEGLEVLKDLNIGSSVAYGRQDQSPSPVAFRMAGGSPDTAIPGQATVPFLILNRDVLEQGQRLVGSVHAAYFYKSLSVIGEWQYGFGTYARPGVAPSRVPYGGFYVSGGYFLTGEHIQRRARLYPRRPLLPTSKDQQRGLGAWEVAGRFSRLGLGNEVFSGGFADPALWSSSASTTELGLNWYWNEYVKVYMFWLHGRFGDPIAARDGGRLDAVDMFWMRFQLYF